MGGWVGVVGADGDLELAQHAVGFFLGAADHAQGAHAFAVQAVAALAREENRIIIAGKEKLAVWLGRLSPDLLARVIRKVKVT